MPSLFAIRTWFSSLPLTPSPWLVAIALVVISCASAASAAEELTSGRVIEKIVCSEQPANSYALYLPSNYTPARKWPVVYAMDARRGALVPMGSFRAAAERLGFIVVSSYDSESDGAITPNITAMRAMWTDTHSRLSIDDRRIYLAGFSGTVRAACYLALAAPGTIAGIIGAGAGFPPDRPPVRDLPFLFFGTAGWRDFNYVELNELDAALSALQLPHRIEFFDGTHQWMPPELAGEALDWMEVRAMAAGIREKDPRLINALWSSDLSRARALETAGDPVDAARLYTAMAADYATLRDATAATAAAARVQQSPDYASRLNERKRILRAEREYLARAPMILTSTNEPGVAIGQLRIAALQREAGSKDEQSLSSARILSALSGQTGFYLPRDLMAKKKFTRAAFCLRIAAAIRPEDPEVHYDLGAVLALANDHRESLKELRRALSLGFHNAARLERDDDFASLRGDEEFKEIVAAAQAAKR